jgi:capsule biosynthesis phosphatase
MRRALWKKRCLAGDMKRLVLDLDGTITRDDPTRSYADKEPNHEVVTRIREYKALGFTIVVQTARSMRSFENSVGLIAAHTLPVIIDWLKAHDIPYDELHVGKPWCGTEGFYVDDRAIRPREFVSLSLSEIHDLLGSQTEGPLCK